MPNESPQHDPASADAIRRSNVKTACSLVFVVAVFLAAIFVIWVYFTGHALPAPLEALSIGLYEVIFACLGVVLIPMIILWLCYMLLTRERMILGNDRLQVVQRFGRHERVTAQIPYRNIDTLASAKDEDNVRFVGVNLRDIHDVETFHLGTDFAREKSVYGYNFRILGGYEKSIDAIANTLMQRLEQFRQRGRDDK